MEPVDERAAARLARQAPGDQLGRRELAVQQVLGERVPPRRREPAAVSSGHLVVEAALDEVLAGRAGLGRTQLLGVEGGRGTVGLDESGSLPGLTSRTAASLVEVAQLDAGAGGQPLGRLGEAQVLDALDETDDVTADAAAEAVEQALGRRHRERRGFLVVERAQPLEVAPAGVAQLDLLA